MNVTLIDSNRNYFINQSATLFQNDSTEKTSHVFWYALNYLITVLQIIATPIYILLDEGIANLMGLQILRHGTALPNYVSIMTEGADPSYGGSDIGSSMGFCQSLDENPEENGYVKGSKNHFHVFRDSHLLPGEKYSVCADLALIFVSRIGPSFHAALSSYSITAKEEHCCLLQKIKILFYCLLGLITPTLRFKFTPDEMKIFKDDPDYTPFALKTAEKIDANHIGIMGSLKQGLNSDLFCRIYHNPCKFLLGVIQLALAVALTALAIFTLYPYLPLTF